MHAKITTLPGDGIGPEVVAEGVKLLQAVAAQFGHTFEFTECLIGGIAIDQTGAPLPGATLAACRASDAVLLGAVGGPKWSDPRASVRPEQGLLGLRGGLGLFANIRPVKVYPALASASTLKPEVVSGVDMVIVRELTGGLYFGEPRGVETLPPFVEVQDQVRELLRERLLNEQVEEWTTGLRAKTRVLVYRRPPIDSSAGSASR